MHDGRALHGIGLAYALSNRGACHVQHMDLAIESNWCAYPEVGLNRGVVAPKGTPADVIAHYAAAFEAAMKSDKVKKALDEKGTWIVYKGPDEYRAFFEKSYADSEKVAIKIGMYKK